MQTLLPQFGTKMGEGGESGLKSDFTHSWSYLRLQVSCRCMRCRELILARHVWAERSAPDSFWVPSHWLNSAKGEQMNPSGHYNDSEQASRLPNAVMPSANVRSANLLVFTSLVWRGRGSNPGLPHSSGRSNHYAKGPVEQKWVRWRKMYDSIVIAYIRGSVLGAIVVCGITPNNRVKHTKPQATYCRLIHRFFPQIPANTHSENRRGIGNKFRHANTVKQGMGDTLEIQSN